MSYQKIAIIGGGNLGAAIAQGLLKSGFSQAADITVTKRNTTTLAALQRQGVQITSDNAAAIQGADVVLVALKPYNVREILTEFKAAFNSRQLIISVVTGVFIDELEAIVGHGLPVFRAMPNTAIAIEESMTCICQKNASPEQVNWVTSLFNTVGVAVNIEEKLMDAATVLGACGIAYALRFIRANIQGGIEIGFDVRTANLIAAQTIKGAAELLIRGGRHPEEEIDKVTTPKGCTIVGLNEMEHQGFSSSLIKGIMASYDKIITG
ncbi:pyrroline-5-carboxylate reductase [Chitinophaga costaii]|uniref:Pyrroline-5-carboxylate reductase n=1 Tax=Chitinophaga costaii TaxID=1335309 RepID=A0A1C4ALX7_9BACT|nr:pyrroline-5-carboxylate reductase [Chitinophaga costaii]PUZ26660.1 pyrroline-5-carboxylate reductase [Chitinophaga costaii]SCB95571.1 pyrroline-5-carboxylate reductase [Chitinophaga costaii]